MKKLATLLFSLVLLIGLCPASLADTVYLPESEFKAEERIVELREYYTNGPKGYVLGYQKPGGSGVTVQPNGQCYTVYYTYVDESGETWGCIEYEKTRKTSYDPGAKQAWVHMSDLLIDYDSDSFVADHAEEIEESAQIFTLERDTKLICWRYPGSGVISDTIQHKKTEPEDIKVTMRYADREGRQWGYCRHYIIKTENAWVCLDDPFNEDLAPGEECVDVLAQLTPAADEAAMAAALKEVKAPNDIMIFGTIGVVAIAGTLLVYVLVKKKKV